MWMTYLCNTMVDIFKNTKKDATLYDLPIPKSMKDEMKKIASKRGLKITDIHRELLITGLRVHRGDLKVTVKKIT